MNVPSPWTSDSADTDRDEVKRLQSPASFFCSQGRALVLAAKYFVNERLTPAARGGVASKHRHRIYLALFGQLMAAFEYLCKDYLAKVIDELADYDDMICKQDWIEVDAKRVLLFRSGVPSPGALLVHPSLGWHSPQQVNARYQVLFGRQPISKTEIPQLEQLWILRHSVAHNAGYVTAYDAQRGNMPSLSQRVVAVDELFIDEQHKFLCNIAERLATLIGGSVLDKWLNSRTAEPPDWLRDGGTYTKLRQLAFCQRSRAQPLPEVTEAEYEADLDRIRRGE